MTKLGQKIIKFTKTYTKKNDISPTRREIMDALNIKSSDAIEYAIRRLEEDGKIQRSPGRARNLFVIS